MSGDLLSSVVATFSAILPISVLRPVANTTANALPVSAEVPAYNIEFLLSSSNLVFSLFFTTPILSPVRIDSSIVKLFELITLASAAIFVPDSTTIISPGTTSLESISKCLLSLITFTLTFIKFFKASEFFSAFIS